jgi:hypothetical protein
VLSRYAFSFSFCAFFRAFLDGASPWGVSAGGASLIVSGVSATAICRVQCYEFTYS